MDKIIFQIALLGFFIATVIFCLQSIPLHEVIINAFIVAIFIVILAIVIMGIIRYRFTGNIYSRHFGMNTDNGVGGGWMEQIVKNERAENGEHRETTYLFQRGSKRHEPPVETLFDTSESGVVDWMIAEKRTIIMKINRRR